MKGLKIGHVTHEDKGTGVSVFLFDEPAVGSYYIAGSAPASHELAPLDADASVPHCHGLVLTGGSAFGLFAAYGVMRWLAEHEKGHPVPHGVVPIVPAAAIYDMSVQKAEAPTEQDGYKACVDAIENNTAMGAIGAGTGATIGKLIPHAVRTPGGFGHAELTLPNGVSVAAYAVVNAMGDIFNERGEIIAGARLADGSFADCQRHLLTGNEERRVFANKNTTLVAIFTNARFSKPELKRIAKMAVAGMGRAIAPVFTQYDGDIIFAVSIGEQKASELMVGTLAAEVVRMAIVNAVSGK